MIKFHEDTQLTIVEEFDFLNDNIINESTPVFKAGELVDADIVKEEDGYVDLQFGDGSVAFTIQRDCFDVVDDNS